MLVRPVGPFETGLAGACGSPAGRRGTSDYSHRRRAGAFSAVAPAEIIGQRRSVRQASKRVIDLLPITRLLGSQISCIHCQIRIWRGSRVEMTRPIVLEPFQVSLLHVELLGGIGGIVTAGHASIARHPRAFASAARPHVLPVAHD